MSITMIVYLNGYVRKYFELEIHLNILSLVILSKIIYRSQSCPQCRERCCKSQLKRIYIDFADDEDFACAVRNMREVLNDVNASAEETIKILLEHIEKPKPQCESCKVLQTSIDTIQTEKAEIVFSMRNLKLLNEMRIENLTKKVSADEVKIGVMTQKLNKSENENKVLLESKQVFETSLKKAKVTYSIVETERNIMKQLLEEKNRQNKHLLADKQKLTNVLKKRLSSYSDALCRLLKAMDENSKLSFDNQELLQEVENLQKTIRANEAELVLIKKRVASIEDMRMDCNRYFNKLEAMNNKCDDSETGSVEMAQLLEYQKHENTRLSFDYRKLTIYFRNH